MTETPSFPFPVDHREQAILADFRGLRDKLLLLKQDRSAYIKSSDVLPIYDKTVEQVQRLNDIPVARPKESNQTDRVLDCCFQLLSLFFMTIGRNNEAPAAYALTSTIKRLLDHLTESDLYSANDLTHIELTLKELWSVVKDADRCYSDTLIALLTKRIELCQSSLTNLQNRLARLHGNLPVIHEKLISILRMISSTNTSTKFSPTEIHRLQRQVQEIDHERVDGKFVEKNGEAIKGNDEVCELLRKCYSWSNIVLEQKGEMPEPFQSRYQALIGIRDNLARLSITQAWSLRETDLYDYQRQLDEIDESRINGNFHDADGNPAELYVQRTFLYLIRRSYSYIYYLMVASEPISEGLLPVYNQLLTLKRCLVEVKNLGGVSSPRELYPYTMKLNFIDKMQVDGKFYVGNDVPEGQSSVNELLKQCHDLCDQLHEAVEEIKDGED
ncbi:hypothetical protein K3495_g8028 [Podosphaera aphanis]|nr:hypothetical protein K3495_g8028 [Podosphaera aphanis]